MSSTISNYLVLQIQKLYFGFDVCKTYTWSNIILPIETFKVWLDSTISNYCTMNSKIILRIWRVQNLYLDKYYTFDWNFQGLFEFDYFELFSTVTSKILLWVRCVQIVLDISMVRCGFCILSILVKEYLVYFLYTSRHIAFGIDAFSMHLTCTICSAYGQMDICNFVLPC